MSLMKSFDIRQFYIDHWRMIGLYVFLVLILVFAVTYKLHSLVPGFTASEVQTYQASESLKTIFHNPVNAPYHLLGWIVIKAHTSEPLVYFRVISAWLGLCTLALFCGLLYYWHGHRVAILGTILFGSSDWFLHIARLGTPAVLMFGILALIACGVWLQATMSPYAMLILLLLSAGLMYVPGMPWIILASLLVNWRRLDTFFSKRLLTVTIGMIVAIGLLVPLGWAIATTPRTAKLLLNLPSSGWPSLTSTLKHLAAVPLHVFVYGPSSPVFSLGHLPVLSVFASAMFLFGVYYYLQHRPLHRCVVLASLIVVGGIVTALGGPTNIGLLTPLLFLVASAGIGYLFKEWFHVFPRNPIAQGVGVGSLAFLVLLTGAYTTRAYFVSWPDASSTRAVFAKADIGSPKTSDTIK